MPVFNYRDYGRLWRVYGRSLLRYGTTRKLINALRTEWAYRRCASFVRSAPYILFLEPLYYCNLDCPLCDRQVFPSARRSDAGRLTLDLYDKILSEIGDYLFQCQIFGQGEPLLDWPLTRQIIERSHKRRIFTLLSTNCTLVTAQIAAELVGCGLDHLVCAIDGITQKSYQMYRVGGDVQVALEGLKTIVEERKRQRSSTFVEWQFLVHGHNVEEVHQAKLLAKTLGVHIRFAPLRGMEWDVGLQRYWWNAGSAPVAEKVPQEGEPLYDWPCYFLWRSLVLNSNGKVARCLLYQNIAQYADLSQMSAMEAYNHPSVQRARQLFSQEAVSDGEFPAPCNHCSFYRRRHGGENLGKRGAVQNSLPVLQN